MKELSMDIFWHTYLMEKNAVFTAITKKKLADNTNILIIFVLEKHHWFCHCFLLKRDSHCLPRFYVSGNKTQIIPENAAKSITSFSSCKYCKNGL